MASKNYVSSFFYGPLRKKHHSLVFIMYMANSTCNTVKRKKTSISLPPEARRRWFATRAKFVQSLPGLLSRYHRARPRRDRFRRYASRGGHCEILSVYWDMATYNKLHTIAAALRMSVSLLISELLENLESNSPRHIPVLNYAFSVFNWSSRCMQISESLEFFATPPPLTP